MLNSSSSSPQALYDVPSRSEQEQKTISPEHQLYYIKWAFEIFRNLLTAGLNGEWNSFKQQHFDPSSDELILLRSAEGAKDPRPEGDAVFNKYCQHAYMSLLRPSAFLTPTSEKNHTSKKEQQQQEADKSTEDQISSQYQLVDDDDERNKFSFVMFIGWRKPDLSGSSELWKVEDGLMEDLISDESKSIHYYCVLPIADGVNYINIVIGRELKEDETPINLMGKSTFHQRAVMNASPEAYDWVRIHGGSFQFQQQQDQQLSSTPVGGGVHGIVKIHRTLCVDFGKKMPPKLTAEMLTRFLKEKRDEEDQQQQQHNHVTTLSSPITENHPFSSSFSSAVATAALSCPYARRGVEKRYVEQKEVQLKF